MFNPTKAFKNTVSSYPNEPSLRVGRRVPENAVNLAYYYNPTATDAEKVLTAEAPRNTIDHRVEEAYRYLFNQASDDDDLFPGSVEYQDEEGYKGQLGRLYVNWYPEPHIETKNIKDTKEIIIQDKSSVPKMYEYSDDNGYEGTLYFDAAEYEVTKTKEITTTETLYMTVNNHELQGFGIWKMYFGASSVDNYMKKENWPEGILVTEETIEAILPDKPNGSQQAVSNYINRNNKNPYDGYTGTLSLANIEYEPVIGTEAKDGERNTYILGTIDFYINSTSVTADDIKSVFAPSYAATYNSATDSYDYTNINTFLNKIKEAGVTFNPHTSDILNNVQNAMNDNRDIVIYYDPAYTFGTSIEQDAGRTKIHISYYYANSTRGQAGTMKYNVIANYSGVLSKKVHTSKEVPTEYIATCNYVGLARKVWYDYDGVAYYRGPVTKGNGIGNVNPTDDNELLMFSDEEGYLRTRDNYYRVEADYVYLTNVFKDGEPCFYKYPLKQSLYDYRGPDVNGFYEGDAIKIYMANLKEAPDNYKHNIKLTVLETETEEYITEDFQKATREVPKRYKADLYTSFISNASDTFKVTYNGFNDSETDNIAVDSGITESIYNYPYMRAGRDFVMESVDVRARVNKIKLPDAHFIEDTRHYITFEYTITAENKKDNKKFTTTPRTASILNKDYVVKVEYENFEERGMIISPKSEGIYMSPMDLVLYDQASAGIDPIIKSGDKDFVFYATITSIEGKNEGAVNIKCNPDGSGNITAETTVDTGFFNETTGKYTGKLSVDNPYLIENGKIYPGYKVKCIDSRHIKVNAPRQDGLLESWYPMIQFGHYSQILDQYGTHIKVCYTMPEYDEQYYSPVYKKPYVDVTHEPVDILNSRMVKTKCFPLLVEQDTIKLYKIVDDEEFLIGIQDVSFSDGVIITNENISENDQIVCDYTYVEENYIYRGYWRNKTDFARIDLNPNQYHTYSDLNYTPSETKPSKNLFNKVIYFFMRPTVEYEVSEENDSLVYNPETDEDIGTVILENKDTLYHQIDNAQPESDHDIYIGSVYIRQNTSLKSTILVDSRTRGGGIIETMKDTIRRNLEPESDYYLDIGYYDGQPYQENGVIIVRLDNKLLKEFGGRFTQGDIEEKVKRWLGFGVYPIIEYVDTYSKRDMPQYSLIVEDSYTNVIDETPEIFLDCIEIS